MRKALPHFADPKFLQLTLVVAFHAWEQTWKNYYGFTDEIAVSVRQNLVVALAKDVGHDPSVGEAIEKPKQFYLDNCGYDGQRDVDMLEKFLETSGCWLRGELLSRSYHELQWAWARLQVASNRGLNRTALNNSGIVLICEMMKSLGYDNGNQVTTADFKGLTLGQALGFRGIGPETVKVINLFRADCGFPPLK
ncbi:MAG: hypothetical protein WC451_03605 [Patescibacteria group bacterium]|jgi:hypothetical protein